jgi:hypothetical protein
VLETGICGRRDKKHDVEGQGCSLLVKILVEIGVAPIIFDVCALKWHGVYIVLCSEADIVECTGCRWMKNFKSERVRCPADTLMGTILIISRSPA